MKNHETVPGPSIGQVLELSAAVLKQLPKDLLPEEAQYWIGHQSRLGEVLRQALKTRDIFENVRDSIRETQLSRLIQLGYAEAAGMTKEAFAQLIPVLENRDGALFGALLVIPANIISIDKQMELVGGRNHLDLNSLKDTVLTPDRPYWIYGVEDGKKMLGKSPDTCVRDFASQNRRGLIVVEGINLIAQYPNVVQSHRIHCPASRRGADSVSYLSFYGSKLVHCPASRRGADSVSYLSFYGGKLELNYFLSSSACSSCGSASCLR